MGTASVRSGSHPVIQQTVVYRSVQVTVIKVDTSVGVSPSLLYPAITSVTLSENPGDVPRFKNLPFIN